MPLLSQDGTCGEGLQQEEVGPEGKGICSWIKQASDGVEAVDLMHNGKIVESNADVCEARAGLWEGRWHKMHEGKDLHEKNLAEARQALQKAREQEVVKEM